MKADITAYLMGDPISASRRPPTDEEIVRSQRGARDQTWWSEQEEALLRQMWARDWSLEAIGRALHRTRHQCSRKAQRLGLPARLTRKVGFKGWRRRRTA